MEVLVKRLDLFLWQKGQRDTFCPDKGWKQRMYDIKNSVTNSAKNFTGKNSLPGIKKEDYPNGYSSLIQSPTYRADFSGDIVELLNKNINPNLITIPFAINLKSLYDYDKMPAKYESIAREAMNSLVGKVIEVDSSIGHSLASYPVTINLVDINSVRKVLGIKV